MTISGQRNRRAAPELVGHHSGPAPQRSGPAGKQVKNRGRDLAINVFREQNSLRRLPVEAGSRRSDPGSDVMRISSHGGNNEDIAAGKSFITHQAFDKRNGYAIRRPTWHCNLQMRLIERLELTAVQMQRVELSDVPVSIASATSGRGRERLAIRGPIEFINVHVRRR